MKNSGFQFKVFVLALSFFIVACNASIQIPDSTVTTPGASPTAALPAIVFPGAPNPVNLSNLLGYWNAVAGSRTGSVWKDLTGNNNAGALGQGAGWQGSGTAASAYSVGFNGAAGGAVDFGTEVTFLQSKILFSSWVSAVDTTRADEVIFGNNVDSAVTGFTLRQSATTSGVFELLAGSVTCASSSHFLDGDWNHISGLIDGANTSLFVNGRRECTGAMTSPVTATSPSDFIAGSTYYGSHLWAGQIASLELYGSSNGSSVGTSSTVKADFDATADTFRVQPVGAIATNGLVLHLDAANAVRGLTAASNGCANTAWFDLSAMNIGTTLMNFVSCGTYGWQGDGSLASPYSLVFDGGNTNVAVGTQAALELTDVTIAAWVNIAGYSNPDPRIFHYSNSATGVQYLLVLDSGADAATQSFWGGYAANALEAPAFSAPTGSWLHLAMTYTGGTVTLYANGHAQPTTANAPVYGDDQATVGCRKIGGNCQGTLTGSLPILQVYNRALTQTEITQNCRAQQGRFSASAICN